MDVAAGNLWLVRLGTFTLQSMEHTNHFQFGTVLNYGSTYFSMHMLCTVQNLVAKFNPEDCSYKLNQTLVG